MCRNHSHLIAQFTGEDTNGDVPVLTFQLAKQTIAVESGGRPGSALILPTSGQLLLPSIALGDYALQLQPGMVAPSMSLCFLPDNAMITMRAAWKLWSMSLLGSGITW